MPLSRAKDIVELANRIVAEHDSEKLIALITELRTLLRDEIKRIEGKLAKSATRSG